MKKKIVIGLIVLILAAVTGYAFIGSGSGESNGLYSYGKVSRGNLESTISATGTLSPLTTVEVGTQVSGTIDSVFVDYNDVVKRGQLLAVLDTVLLKATVLDAEAGLEKAQAQLEQSVADESRYRQLRDQNLVSAADYLPFKVSLKSAQASVKSAEATLQRAKSNLDYAVIRSPISGTVIGKDVESGQTVAASLSTPTLFQIAEDMSHMEILAEVDESDIGQIKEGQKARFEVQAYSDKMFDGVVTQIRLQPTTISNVVTYTVVVQTTNSENLLLPGMTATVDFIIESRDDVLLVPSSALRFEPSEEEMMTLFEKRRGTPPPQMSDSTGSMPPGGGPGAIAGERLQDMSMVWYLDDSGELEMEPVKIGMSDGTNTEIVMTRSLHDGMEIITGTAKATTGTTTKSTQRQGGPPMGPPGF